MNQESEKQEPPSQAAPVNTPQVKMPQVTLSKDEVKSFFNEATKYTVFGIATLYAIGFIIWHSYLAEYGVSSFEFLQAEYFSATICYLIFVAMFALPAALLYLVLLEKKKLGELDAGTIIFIWSTLSYQFLGRFFPNYLMNMSNSLMNGILAISLISLVYVVVFVFATLNLHFKWTAKRGWKRSPEAIRDRIKSFHLATIGILALGIIYLFSIQELSKQFLLFTLLLYPVLSYGFQMGGQDIWNKGEVPIKVLILTFCVLVIVGNIQIFGAVQFGKISRQMGGGKAETAFVRFAPQCSDLASLLTIQTAAKTDSPSGFAGPIQILMRSDKQFIFITSTNSNSPDIFTNFVSLNAITNSFSTPTTNQELQVKTNLLNVAAKPATKPAVKPAAKQVRADLIDAIIFVK